MTLGDLYPNLEFLTLGILNLFSAGTILAALPETKGKEMPNSIEESLNLYKKRKNESDLDYQG